MRVSNLKTTAVSEFGDFTVVPKGNYDLMIVSAEDRIAKSSGNAYILVGYRILNNDDEPSVKGRYVWGNINNNDVGMQILKSILTFNNSPLSDLEGDVDFDPQSLVGMKVSAKIGIEKDLEGNDRNNVRYFKPVNEQFAGTTLEYFDKKGQPSTVTTPVKSTVADGNDGLPF